MEAIERVVDGGQYVMGEEVEAFEQELALFTGAKYAIGCGSGSDALSLSLQAADVGPGDEVLCPAFSFFSTASSIARLGAHPVFVDIHPQSLNMDLEATKEIVSECTRLKALLPVDLFGRVAQIDGFVNLGEEIGVPVIEDAAQAIGARDGELASAGTKARMGCISFYPSKNLGALGEGGAILTADEAVAERLRNLRTHGQSAPNHFTELGFNSRLDALQAAILRVKLQALPEWLRARKEVASYYDAKLSEAGALPWGSMLSQAELPLLYPPTPPKPAQSAHHQYTIQVLPEVREALRSRLSQRGIETAIYYAVGLHEQPALAKHGRTPRPLTITDEATRSVMSLPCHPGINSDARSRVMAALVEEVKDLVQLIR